MKYYPRLIKSMKNAACLSESEATIYQESGSVWSSEAANHFGGFRELIKYARRSHSFRATRGLLRETNP